MNFCHLSFNVDIRNVLLFLLENWDMEPFLSVDFRKLVGCEGEHPDREE
jgi:hypothetical protein